MIILTFIKAIYKAFFLSLTVAKNQFCEFNISLSFPNFLHKFKINLISHKPISPIRIQTLKLISSLGYPSSEIYRFRLEHFVEFPALLGPWQPLTSAGCSCLCRLPSAAAENKATTLTHSWASSVDAAAANGR